MAHESVTVAEIVEHAVNHAWSVPEFQRGFVWKSVQVRDLIESLWLNYPIGTILLWDSQGPVVERLASDAQRPGLWLVDGQQRTTALCILFGRKPYWWPSVDEWERTIARYDIRFDVHTKEPPYFLVANAAIRKAKDRRYLKVSELLSLNTEREQDSKRLQDLAKEIKLQGLCDGMDAMEVYARLDRLRKIREKDMVKVTVNHDLEDVVEIFGRLNSRGTRVTEADIYLGIVAGRNPGWVKEQFLPYLNDLKDLGFELGPNLLFRCTTAIGTGRVRFRDISDKFWSKDQIEPAWAKTKNAWNDLVLRLREYGALTNAILPSENALVTLSYLINKFPAEDFRPVFHWFLQASRFGRYSGSATTALEEDLKDIAESQDRGTALDKLLARIPGGTPPMAADDFKRDYGDSRFGRFILYLLVYANGAQDWDEKKHRLGFQGQEALAGFQPQWHHIFPRRFLDDKFGDEVIDALANIAVIGPKINIRISNKAPMKYITQYAIDASRLEQQFVFGSIEQMTLDQYPDWLNKRATKLTDEANRFLSDLRSQGANAKEA